MPQIPTKRIAPQGTGVAQTPDVITSFDTPDIGRAIGSFGEKIGGVFAKLGEQQSELELATMAGDYEAGIKAIRFGLDNNPATQDRPEAYGEMFKEQSQALVERLVGNAKSRDGAAYFANYLRRKYPMDEVEAVTHGAKLFKEGQVAILDVAEKRMIKDAVEAPTPADQALILDAHSRMLKSSAERGLISPADAIKRAAKVPEQVEEGTMAMLVRTDRSRLRLLDKANAFRNVPPEKRAMYLEQANKADEHAANKAIREDNEAQDKYYNQMLSLAATGNLSNAIIENGIAGNDPVLQKTDKWIHIKNIADNPPSGEGAAQVRLIAAEYYVSLPRNDEERKKAVSKALGELVQLQQDIGAPVPAAIKLSKELQNELDELKRMEIAAEGQERARKGAGRADRAEIRAIEGQEASRESQERARKNAAEQKINNDVRKAISSYDAQVGPNKEILESFRTKEEYKRRNERARIQDLIRNQGVTPQDAVNKILEDRRGSKGGGVTPGPQRTTTPSGKPKADNDQKIEQILENAR